MVHQIVKTSKGKTISYVNSIYFEITHPNTYAAYLLMKKDYQDQVNSYYVRQQLILFSRGYLNKIQKKYGTISCTYCGKPNLIIEEAGMRVSSNIIATIDHIQAKSKGGEYFDEKNVTACCSKCNSKKSNGDVLTFLGY